jgi:hypothetical protein
MLKRRIKNEEAVFNFHLYSNLCARCIFLLFKTRSGMRTKGNHGLGNFRSGSLAIVNDCTLQKEKELFLFLLIRADNRNNYNSCHNAEEIRMGEAH